MFSYITRYPPLIPTSRLGSANTVPLHMARQQHGFDFENTLITKHSWTKSKSYTDEFDAYTKKNIPVQIKTVKAGTEIDFGDVFRNADKKHDFILVVAFWKGVKTNIIEQTALHIEADKWRPLFSFADPNALPGLVTDGHSHIKKALKEEMNLISNMRVDDGRWKQFMTTYKKTWADAVPTEGPPRRVVELRFKRDHKKQKRLQCAIKLSNWHNYFLNIFPSVELADV